MDMQKCGMELDQLVNGVKKGKKSYSEEDLADYNKNLQIYLAEAGMSGTKTFSYINALAKICGLDVVVGWLGKRDDPAGELNRFLHEPACTNADANVRAAMIFSILCSLLNQGGEPRQCLPGLLAALSSASRKRDKKWLASLAEIFRTRFSERLARDARLPDLAELQLERELSNSLRSMAEHIYGQMEKSEIKPDGTKHKRVLEWLGKKYPPSSGNAPQGALPKGPPVNAPDGRAKDGSANAKNGQATQTGTQGAIRPHESEDPLFERASATLKIFQGQLREFWEQQLRMENENKRLQQDIYYKSKEIEKLEKAKQEIADSLNDRTATINRLAAEKNALKDELSRLQTRMEKDMALKDGTLEDLKQEIEIRDCERNEARNRLARELTSDYREWLDIANDPMTVELGEVLRVKLEQLFQVLARNGINPGVIE